MHKHLPRAADGSQGSSSSGVRTCRHVVRGQLQLHPLQLALPFQPLPLPLGSRRLLLQQQGLQFGALGLQRER